jgi:thiol-disulfide isomerase/thioredoxin
MLTAIATAIALAAPPAAPPPSVTYALLINGGGSPRINYLSHLHHLQDMAAELRSRGIPPERIEVLSADGDDEKADLAAREPESSDQWLIEGTPAAAAFTQPDLTNTKWEGVKLHPARLRELRKYFSRMSDTLHPGDTLFVFVTDHGKKDDDDPENGFINLWNETMSLLEFRALLAHLKPGVRIATVMSQCYSGAFADAMSPFNSPVPTGDVCGFFSTLRDRPAFGCYPEGRDRDRIGHAFAFIEAMGRHGTLEDDHDAVLLLDTSPDVPIRTSDLFLERLVRDEAGAKHESADALVDRELASAWKNRGRWEPQIRLMDRIGEVYGFPSPRTLAELKPRLDALEALSKELDTYEDRWKLSLDDLRRINFDKLVESDPNWKSRLDPQAIAQLDPGSKQSRLTELLGALRASTDAHPDTRDRLVELHATYEAAKKARYVVDVRLAALLRMRALLIRVAGLTLLEEGGAADSRRALDGLTRCEAAVIGSFDTAHESSVLSESPEPLPPLASDLEAVRRALPSWLGIEFLPLSDSQRERFSVGRGAVFVQRIVPDGPAATAGLKVGDILVGPAGRPFEERTQIREWTMTSPRGTPLALDIMRDGKPSAVNVTLAPYPEKFPDLPPPPKEGDEAPSLASLRSVRPDDGGAAVLDGGRRMLFFWATWCAPCKASIPTLLAWSRKSGVPVLAVSDEDEETIRRFLGTWTEPFPEHVFSDGVRQAFLGYAVSGTPTFVLVDANGKIAWRHTGYSPNDGLAIP